MLNSAKKIIPALALFSLLTVSPAAFANNQAKLALAKKVVFEATEISPYADPQFKKILQKAHQINQREAKAHGDVGCEFYESPYLGGGTDAPIITSWKAGVTKSGMVRATFNNTAGDTSGHLIEFDMTCRGSSCVVNDVRIANNWDSATPPQRTKYSLRKDAQAIVSANGCGNYQGANF